jgi:hypothetical protein
VLPANFAGRKPIAQTAEKTQQQKSPNKQQKTDRHRVLNTRASVWSISARVAEGRSLMDE